MAKDEYGFVSSNLDTGVFDDETRTMQITFKSGRTYEWERAEPVMWDRLKSAVSPGRFLQENFGTGREI